MTSESPGEKSGVSNQLATLVPTFDPSKDDLEQYVQKIEMLADIWPADKLNELGTRLILNATGPAFQKLQLQRKSILTNDKEGIQKLVTILGGQWGKVSLERKYDVVEKALFRCIQRSDESNDSYLARTDIYWSELAAKKTSLTELQAYIVLRGSLLSQDDKKRVILESDASTSGDLEVDKVCQSIRMLGSGFFHDMVGTKRNKGKIYDATALTMDDAEEPDSDQVFNAEECEEDLIDALAQEGDEDAAFVNDFEAAVTDAAQEDPELASALNAYTDARRRLSERFKNRGFWPTNPSKGKGKGKGFKGRGKSSYKGSRKSLQQRISESTCRICHEVGHWKAECPKRNRSAPSGTASTPSTAATMTAVSVETTGHPDDFLPLEFTNLPVLSEETIDETRPQTVDVLTVIFRNKEYNISTGKVDGGFGVMHTNRSCPPKRQIHPPMPMPRNDRHEPNVQSPIQKPGTDVQELATDELAFFATHGSHGIIDTGATKSVIGSDLLPDFLKSLNPDIRDRVHRCKCSITFRFGNQGMLDSTQAIVIPIGNLGLKIAIVKGKTPLLVSNTLLRTLKSLIDTDEGLLHSRFLSSPVKLHLSSRGLYLIDVNDLATRAQKFLNIADTFSSCSNAKADRPPFMTKTAEVSASPNVEKCTGEQTHTNKTDNSETLQQNKVETLSKTDETHVAQCTKDDMTKTSGSDVSGVPNENVPAKAHHEPGRSLCPCPGESPDICDGRNSRSLQTTALRRAVQHQGGIREDTLRQDIPGNVSQRTQVGVLDAQDIRGVTEAGTSEVLPLHSDRGERRDTADLGIPRSTTTTAIDGQSQGKTPCSSSISEHPDRDRDAPPGNAGSGPRHLVHGIYGTKSTARDDQCSAGKNGRHGERDDGDFEPHPPVLSSETQAFGLMVAGDPDHGVDDVHNHTTRIHTLQDKYNKLVIQISTELENHKHNRNHQYHNMRYPKIDTLEIFCSHDSELTRLCNQLGHKAERFGLSQGDLATAEGRSKLFDVILKHEPRDVWYSPVCGPWSPWNVFNENQSMELYHKINKQREENLFQLALGIVLLRHQYTSGRHLHWEQPRRSLMFKTPLIAELYDKTFASNFDMCQVGELKDPVNQKLMKKSMTVRTTSKVLHESLNGRRCNRNHQHQPLEGSVKVSGKTMTRTEYSERYPRKFARAIAKGLQKSRSMHEPPKEFHQWSQVFAASVKREATKSSQERPNKFLRPPARLIDPDDMPRKRRRLDSKTSEIKAKELTSQILEQVKKTLPRVGRHEIHDPKIKQQIQDLLEDKHVVRVVACKGTERTLAPPTNLLKGEAPFRKALVEVRGSKRPMIEDSWEPWENLAKRQLIRSSHSSHVNITVFAANPDPDVAPIQHPEASSSSQPSVPDELTPEESAPVDGPEPVEPDDDKVEIPQISKIPEPNSSDQADIQSQQHGSRFLALPAEERSLLIRIHKNLGHPSPQVLGQVLRQRGYPRTMTQALEDYQCSTCIMHQKPKIPRPATLKTETDFGDKVSTDGVTWTNQSGTSFHFYHYLDHGTNFQVAVAAPNRSAEQAIEKFVQAWISWAGPPNELYTDSATEFTSETFQKFLQQNNIKPNVIPPDAHWQLGRTERHGEILQTMLSKYETEHAVQNYADLQIALAMCTAAKNSCSLRHGFSPEVLVFGKGLRLPGSLSSDDHLPSHMAALDDTGHGIRFRTQLAMRESARKAFHEADNNMAIRRAALRRSRPHRGDYLPGEWVMIWKLSENTRRWVGPCKVITQESTQSLFAMYHGTLIRAAPEHVRPVSAVEAQLIPELESLVLPSMIPRENPQPPSLQTQPVHTQPTDETIPTPQDTNDRTNQSSISEEQPDVEPESPHNEQNVPDDGQTIPVPHGDTDDELVCDMLLCHDLDDQQHLLGNDQLAWRFEIDFPEIDDIMTVTDENLEDMIMIATNQKKQRTEVKLSTLTPDEVAEFDKAKKNEIDNWLKTGTVCKILRNKLSPEQILRCRWIYVWKPIEDREEQKVQGKSRKAKARLVVLGYMDPSLETIPRDSPTLGRQSRMLVLQLIASMNWELSSFDIKAAFLQGKTQEDRVIAIEPVPEMVKAMQLQPQEVCRLNKSAYGLVDAPYLWFQELDKTLKSLGFMSSPFDPTVYLLFDDKTNEPAGILGVHVDDGLCGGNQKFKDKINELERIFPFGSKKVQNLTFTGIDLHQNKNYSINLSQEKYISKIEPIHITPDRKHKMELRVTPNEQQALRGLIGSLQYASVNTRPDLASRLSHLQSAINSATIQTLHEANKVLHEAKRHKDTTITVQPIPMHNLRFLAFSDASFSSRKQPDSHTGMMIMATHDQISQNVQSPVSPISWGCKKIQKVVVSTLSAEATSLNSTLDQLSWLRLYWAWMLNPQLKWKDPKNTLNQLPESYTTAIHNPQNEDIAVTDCKSLYDLVSRTAPPNCQEFRTQLLARAIKDLMSEGVKLKWVHSGAQLADALTKVMETSFLRETLRLGQYRLHDQDQILKDRANARNRLKWLKTQPNES